VRAFSCVLFAYLAGVVVGYHGDSPLGVLIALVLGGIAAWNAAEIDIRLRRRT
jgi:hypothetical protein